MKDLLALLCIVYVLVISAESLTCKSCSNPNGETCSSEESIECEDASGCVTVAGFTRFNSTKYPFIHKGCPIDIKCGTWLCVTSGELDFQSYVSCCEGENCNPEYFIPFDDSTENCVTCPYCYEEDNLDGCKSETQERCRGDNNLCVEYRGRIRKPDGSEPHVSFKSCANTVAFNKFSLVFGLQEIDTNVFRLVDPIEVDEK
ncbi:phospholipase A2 inhibitor NAI-like [Hyla sarda]|uniref:phospholipase A2 inhibitor NAI-like n=1 Tax=Hyla sarda TaxID=327740 RepID=UPI0024C3A802|nr:phospholipase A2 inhibitor NAI-like [Hyla sarda]